MKRKFEKTEAAWSVLMKYLLECSKQATKVTANDHPINIFFECLVATVNYFSPEYQHMAKSKLFKVVPGLGWAHLHSQNTNSKCQHQLIFQLQTKGQICIQTIYLNSNPSTTSPFTTTSTTNVGTKLHVKH